MRITTIGLVSALVLGLASPATAAAKVNLAVGGRTLAGPGSVSVPIGTSTRVFEAVVAVAQNVCTTVANTGKVDLTLTVTGVTTQSPTVPAGATKAICVEEVLSVDIVCGEVNAACSAQWRVDDN